MYGSDSSNEEDEGGGSGVSGRSRPSAAGGGASGRRRRSPAKSSSPAPPPIIEPVEAVPPEERVEDTAQPQPPHRRPSPQDPEHLSIMCHLFPRLSESNRNFHDLYWNYHRTTGGEWFVTLRKRKVKLSKIIRIRPTPTPATNSGPFIVQLSLVDKRPKGTQIVSNVYTSPLPTITTQQQGRGLSSFGRRAGAAPPPLSVLIRSNYAQPEVALRIDIINVNGGKVGRLELNLLSETGQVALGNKTKTHSFTDTIKVTLEVSDVQAKMVGQADSLPDVLLCDEQWIGMLACYRQLTCELLAKREEAPMSTWLCDPVMATLPRSLTNHKLADYLLGLLNKSPSFQKNPLASSKELRLLYMQHIFPQLDRWPIREGITSGTTDARDCVDKLADTENYAYAPLDIYQLAVHLNGQHSLD